MIKMIGYELKKIFSRKLLYVMLPVMIILGFAQDLYAVINIDRGYNAAYLAERELIRRYGGFVSEENYNYLINEYEEAEKYYNECGGEELGDEGKFAKTRLEDYYILSDIASRLEYIDKYEKDQSALMLRAKENVRLYEERNNVYKARENRQIMRLYDIKPRLKLLIKDGWMIFSANEEIICLLILIALFVSPVFSEERERNMYPILYTGAGGRGKCAAAKLAASAIFTFAVSMVFESARYVIAFFQSGFSDIGEYLQNDSVYEFCPFNITFGGMILADMLLISLGAVCFAMIVCMISALCGRNVVSLAAAVFVIIFMYGNVYRYMYLTSTFGIGEVEFLSAEFAAYFDFSEKYLIAGLFEPQNFFKGYHPVNVMGFPVPSIFVNLSGTLIKIVLFSALAVLAYTKKKYFTKRFALNIKSKKSARD